MENVRYLSLALVFTLLMGACSDDSSTGSEPPTGEEASSKKQFVYNAMNEWYLWQKDVPDLADNRFENEQAKQEFLIGFSDAPTLFDDLLITDDQFSRFIEDYEENEDAQDGIRSALGLNYGSLDYGNGTDRIGFVTYVVPESPADDAGLQRYDLFTKVDGVDLVAGNITELLSPSSSHTLTMAEVDTSNNTLSFPETGETVDVGSEPVFEDPVYRSSIIDTSNVKIGYLKYNAFQSNSHHRLNEVFANFKNENIDELVLDLRYNGGGTVITSQLLSSLISGLGSNETFANFTYNSKNSNSDRSEPFLDVVPLENEDGDIEQNGQGDYVNQEPINALSLDRVYVLTSSTTASASEVLINSLRPFIDVVQIGQTTIGKDVGAIILYDAPPNYNNETNINPNHKNAIQPIVTSFTNANGEDYPNGFTPEDPDLRSNGITFEALFEKKPLGDPEEPIFELAISTILGQPMAKTSIHRQTDMMRNVKVVLGGQESTDMYIEPFMMPQKQKK